MAALDIELAAMTGAIAQQTTEVASLKAFIQGLSAQVAAVPGLTADQQASLDAIKAAVEANNVAIAAAIATPGTS